MKAIRKLLSPTTRKAPRGADPQAPAAREKPGPPPPKARPELPPAIWEYVITLIIFFSNQPSDPTHEAWLRTLHACTGVCRAWRASARRFAQNDDTLLVNSTFLGVLADALNSSPALGASLRAVHLLCASANARGALGYHAHNAATRFLPALAPHVRLPRLAELALLGGTRVHGDAPDVGDDVALLPHLPLPRDLPAVYGRWAGQIRVLGVAGVTFAQFGDLARLVACFPRVRELKLAGVRWSDVGDVPECMERGDGGFLGSLKKLLMGNLLPEGSERILRALKPEAPQEFTSCLFYDETHSEGTRPKFIPLDLARATHLSRLTLGGISKLTDPASVQAMLGALRTTLSSWRPDAAAGALYLELGVSAVPVPEYEQWVGSEPLAGNPPKLSECKAFLKELGQIIKEECPRLPLETLLVTFTNVPGPVENANYWRPFFKNHVFPTGMPALSDRLIFKFRSDLRWHQESSDLDGDTQ